MDPSSRVQMHTAKTQLTYGFAYRGESALSTQPLSITDDAVVKIIEIRDGEEAEHVLALFIEITGIRGPQFIYELSFMPVADKKETDELFTYGELSVLIPTKDVENLDGGDAFARVRSCQSRALDRQSERSCDSGDDRRRHPR